MGKRKRAWLGALVLSMGLVLLTGCSPTSRTEHCVVTDEAGRSFQVKVRVDLREGLFCRDGMDIHITLTEE